MQPTDQELYRGRHLEAIAAHWDAKAPTWDQVLADPACHLNEDDAYHRFLSESHVLIQRRREFCARHGVIDAGCGTGLVLAAVLPGFAWGIGVDVSSEMLRQASAKHVPRARFVAGDCFELPRLCPAVGAVFSRGVLLSHYGPSQGELLLRAARAALVPGGFLVFDFLNEVARSRHAHCAPNKTYFLRTEVCALACRAGFSAPDIIGRDGRRVLLLTAYAGEGQIGGVGKT